MPNLKKILIMGLPGAGKTTLAKELSRWTKGVHFNADEIRQHIHKDLTFSVADRIEHARRLGVLCDIVNRAGHYAIADFVCPTEETRKAFGPCFTIFVDRGVQHCKYADTAALFEAPKVYDFRCHEGSGSALAPRIFSRILDLAAKNSA
jgi:adenylylsulfate kinase